jgi:GAF domain-containing protein
MVKENEAIGVIGIYRQEVRPFSDKQIALVQNFAAQAVIAIENARLLNELRQRTADLTEALEQQTATSKLLQVISNSPGDLEPIFATMLENAIRICDATFGDIFRWEDGTLHLVTSYETPAAFAEMLRRSPVISPGHSSFTRLMLETKTRVHIADLCTDPLYLERQSAQITAAVDVGGVRTVLAVPMFREGELIGEFILNRQEVRPFKEKQIEHRHRAWQSRRRRTRMGRSSGLCQRAKAMFALTLTNCRTKRRGADTRRETSRFGAPVV